MLRRPEATPCPEVHQVSRHRPRDSLLSLGPDNTTDIEFTTECRSSLQVVKPRRRQTAIGGRQRRNQLDFAIHEEQETRQSAQHGISLKGSILSKPPQRPRGHVTFGNGVKPAPDEHSQVRAEGDKCEALPTQPSGTSILDRGSGVEAALSKGAERDELIKRPARRGTIYIPPDDTTVPSIHMGIFSPIKDFENGDVTVEFTGLAAQLAKKRGRRESFVGVPPKRVPLQQSSRPTQETIGSCLIPGKRTGKENIPPGYLDAISENDLDDKNLFDLSKPEGRKSRQSIATSVPLGPQNANIQSERPKVQEKSSLQRARRTSAFCQSTLQRQIATARVDELRQYQTRPAPRSVVDDRRRRVSVLPPLNKPPAPAPKTEKPPAKLTIPEISQSYIQQQYPLLSENISDSSMYEDNWLTHQEIAITQLVNNLFAAAKGSQSPTDLLQLRFELLEIYQDPAFSLLYKRLQASLLYGGLSVPKDVLDRGSRLWADLGMREKFCSFWLDTYDQTVLKAALEVVVGRECPIDSRLSLDGDEGNGAGPFRGLRRSIRTYLETFLIRNEDANPEPGATDHDRVVWSYNRTIQRSLLLTKLLDKAKNSPETPIPGCLFLPSSSHKSSVQAVQAIAQMLNPGVGDILRVLGHIDYFVSHRQYPLDEFEYHIDNLAVDLRDGVRLTRLVELLLYPSASRLLSRARDSDGMTTVTMPTGEVLSLVQGEHDWPLSQHLKVPCLGRATRLFNVQVALSSLAGVRGVEALAEATRAEDIVDGFREKTVALLWGLTGKWGLGGLIDWEDVKRETRRLWKSVDVEDCDEDDEGFGLWKARLTAWVSAIAARRGLEVKNLTTSFADGRVYEAVVDEYEPHLHPQRSVSQSPAKASLNERLVRLGCSSQFANLFAPATTAGPPNAAGNATTTTQRPTHIFTPDTTLASLAFLCSRLLGPTKRVRAAQCVQRAWRAYFGHVILKKRKDTLKRMAHECRDVVVRRERVAWAVGVLERAWTEKGSGRRIRHHHHQQRRQQQQKQHEKLDGASCAVLSAAPALDASEIDGPDLWVGL